MIQTVFYVLAKYGLRRAGDEIEAIALATLRTRMGDLRSGSGIEAFAEEVVRGASDPYAAADRVVADIT